jgi:uroporphyrinogen decarboxylase
MGIKVEFIPSQGPNLTPVRTEEALDKLSFNPEKLEPVYEAVSTVRRELPDSCTLIGFSGSPWTLATYIVEGKSSKDFALVRDIAYRDEIFFGKLMDQLIEAILYHLGKQVENGAEVVQIFDSWASVLSPVQYRKWVIDPTVKIVNAFKCRYPNIPIIAFPKGSGILYKEFSQAVGVEALSIDYTVPMEWARDNLGNVLQGNLDPVCLQSDVNEAIAQTQSILDIMRNKPFIFNLGHGILPGTSIDNVSKVLEVIRNA